jgi:hypothetical protein
LGLLAVRNYCAIVRSPWLSNLSQDPDIRRLVAAGVQLAVSVSLG